MILKVMVVVLGLALSLFLFSKAAGTLNIGKINIVSYIMYLFLLQTYAGASLVYLGDHNHYTMKYITSDASFDLMFYSVLLTALLFPLTILVLYKLFGFDIRTHYENYMKASVAVGNERIAFWVISGAGFVCCCLLLVYIIKIGYFPLLKLARPPADAANFFSTERQRISAITIGNSYIKNILIGMAIPMLSYISFAYALVVKKILWWALTAVLIGASIVYQTINFEKSPLLFYAFVLLLILMYVRGGLKRKTVVAFGVVAAAAIVVIYMRTGYSFNSGDSNFYNGPVGRTLFTQVGTLTMHFDLFPAFFPFLGGRSLSPTALTLLGIEGGHLRSAKLVMDFYGAEKVYDGTGGVMNAFFIGEAYANFGWWGMVLSILYMGVLIGVLFWLFTRLEKNPYNLGISAMLVGKLALATQGGFTDFIYNFQTYLLIFLLIAGLLWPHVWKWLNKQSWFRQLLPAKKGKKAKA